MTKKKTPEKKDKEKMSQQKSSSKTKSIEESSGSAKAKGGKSAPKSAKESETSDNPLGKKFSCYNCGTKFYDLNKPEKICPKCKADQLSKPAQKGKSLRAKISEFDVTEEEAVAPDEEIDGEDVIEESEAEEPIEVEEEEV